MHKNFPFEFIIKEGCDVKKIKKLKVKDLLIKSKKLLKLIDENIF
jgi:hypothetical protein